jgi:hypothetical protein
MWTTHPFIDVATLVARLCTTCPITQLSHSHSLASIVNSFPVLLLTDAVALSPLFPDKLMLGMEIRPSVCQYVVDRVVHMRKEQSGGFENIYAIRSNAMKYLPNYFRKAQVRFDVAIDSPLPLMVS